MKTITFIISLACLLVGVLIFVLYTIRRSKRLSYNVKINQIERAVKYLPLSETNFWFILDAFQVIKRFDLYPMKTEHIKMEFFRKYKDFWKKRVEDEK